MRQQRIAQVSTQRAKQEIKQKGFWRGYLLPKVAFFTVGFPQQAFGSIDITHRCNLRCEHCYFFEQDYQGELSDQQWLNRIENLNKKSFPFRTCTWVGGEPLLRQDLIERAKKFFKFNIVVSNGSLSLPDWPDVYFHISLDGTREVHEKIRNSKGLYDKIKVNVNRPELDVTMVYCISNSNKHCIEEVVEEWYKETAVKGFIFDFYTPIAGLNDKLWLNFNERDKVIDRLIRLKEKYQDFIAIPARVFELMKADKMSAIVNNCPFRKKGFALDPLGKAKRPCMLGAGADCSRCGCVVPFYLTSRTERRYILQEVWGDLKKAGSNFFSRRAE